MLRENLLKSVLRSIATSVVPEENLSTYTHFTGRGPEVARAVPTINPETTNKLSGLSLNQRFIIV
jgi:hypothetical protein